MSMLMQWQCVCVHVFRRQQHAGRRAWRMGLGMAVPPSLLIPAWHTIRVSTFSEAVHPRPQLQLVLYADLIATPHSPLTIRISIFEAQQVISTHKASKIM